MKALIAAAFAAFMLSGCATATLLWDSYTLAKFDSNEYSIVSNIRTQSQLAAAQCGDQQKSQNAFDQMFIDTKQLVNFSQYIPKNDNTFQLAGNLHTLVEQGADMYNKGNVSAFFCKMKLQQIERTAESIQQVVGKRPR